MGISTFILFEKSQCPSANGIKNQIQNIGIGKDIYFASEYEEYNYAGDLNFSYLYFSNLPIGTDSEKTLMWYLYDNNYPNIEIDFNWDNSKSKYVKRIVSDDFYEKEDILFEVVYAILKIYPFAKIWIEDDWFYSLEHLEKISSKPFDKEWCYKNPNNL